MKDLNLSAYFQSAISHRDHHSCGGYPYQHGSMLSLLTSLVKPNRILELGTGLGYSTMCMVSGYEDSQIDTIDQDFHHIEIAREMWRPFAVGHRITTYIEKAEAVLPTLQNTYDLIFFDGYAPSLKFLIHFKRLLKAGGILITANLYVKDPVGGKYVRHLNDQRTWQTGYFSDTAVSVKLR